MLLACVTFSPASAQDIIDASKQPTSYFDLLEQPKVVEDLQLVEEQTAEIRQRRQPTQSEVVSKVREAFTNAGHDMADRVKSIKAVLETVPEIEERALKEVLLDHQLDRARQLRRQTEINRVGILKVLTDMKKDGLELTAEQHRQITESIEKANQERLQLLKDLQAKEIRSILEFLNTDQRAKWTRLIGRPLDEVPTSNLSAVINSDPPSDDGT
jgi:hypothetical protein